MDGVEKALRNKGIELVKPNETCDVVYCYCGIRLHPLSCPEAFSVSKEGKLVGDHSVKRLERDCLSTGGNGFSGLAGCSKCLKSLYLVIDSLFHTHIYIEDTINHSINMLNFIHTVICLLYISKTILLIIYIN